MEAADIADTVLMGDNSNNILLSSACESLVPDPADYHVSPTLGFVLPQPLQRLPPYFDPWTRLVSHMPELISQRQVRDEVHKLPMLDESELSGHRQLRLAHLVLSLIGGAYVWERGEGGMPRSIPRCLAIPWYKVSQTLGLPPVVLHASYALANYRLVDPDGPIDIDNLRLIYYHCGGFDAEWFFLCAIQIEIIFGRRVLQPLLSCMRCVIRSDSSRICDNLGEISDAVREMKATLARIHQHCNAHIFYNVLRPFLSGWDREGLLYEGCVSEGNASVSEGNASGSEGHASVNEGNASVNEGNASVSEGGGVVMRCIGGSAAQSSAIQCLDALLGVQHSGQRRSFLSKMREYMPPSHRAFIEALERAPPLRDYVIQRRYSDKRLVSKYNECVTALTHFRSYHVQIAAKYVIIQASNQQRNAITRVDEIGTGGTVLMPFLKTVRDDTLAATLI